jgi:hypothetical protein
MRAPVSRPHPEFCFSDSRQAGALDGAGSAAHSSEEAAGDVQRLAVDVVRPG